MRKIIIIFSLLLIVSVSVFVLDYRLNNQQNLIAKKNPIIIGLSLGNTKEERWPKDRDFFVKRAQELGAIVNITSADNIDTQISQIENLISQGVKVIVVIPADSEKIAPEIKKAKAAGVKIIAYDRLIKSTDVDLYISFDNEKVGRLEASGLVALAPQGKYAYIGGPTSDNNSALLKKGTMAELNNPKIKSGDIKLVINTAANSWEPEEAYNIIKKYLNSGGALDAVIASNDGLASGVRKALKEKDPDNKVLISGQDAELSACQRIIAGTQTTTVYKQIDLLADKAAEIAVALAQGKMPVTNQTVNNGQADIPEILIEPILVNKDNMIETIVKDGFHTYEDIYQNSK